MSPCAPRKFRRASCFAPISVPSPAKPAARGRMAGDQGLVTEGEIQQMDASYPVTEFLRVLNGFQGVCARSAEDWF